MDIYVAHTIVNKYGVARVPVLGLNILNLD